MGTTRRSIAEHLNVAAVRTHTGRPWTKGTVLKLIAEDKPIRRDGCTDAQVRDRVAAAAAAKRKAATEAFAPIRRIVEHLRSLNYVYADIAIELNSLGYRPPKGERWTAHIIVQALIRDERRKRQANRASPLQLWLPRREGGCSGTPVSTSKTRYLPQPFQGLFLC